MTAKYTADLISKLSKRPLPTLEATLARLTESAQPLLGDAEQAKLADLIAAFQQSDGPVLQSALHRLQVETNANWTTPLQSERYLTNQSALQVATNFAFTISPSHLPDRPPIELAAKLLQNIADQYLAFANETASVEVDDDGRPLDMSGYIPLFRSQRLPHTHRDHFHQTRLALKNIEATVIYRQTVYQILLIDHAGRVATLHSLTEALRLIFAQSDPDDRFIGQYTGLPRQLAAKTWHRLNKNDQNHQNFERIANSLLVMTFADLEASAGLRQTLLGPNEHFFDKTMQVVIDYEKGIGFSFEHSHIDSQPAGHIVDAVIADLKKPEDQWDSKGKPHFERLAWELDSKSLIALQQAQIKTTVFSAKLQFAAATLTQFGRTALEALHVSPDAFFQLVLTLAQYRLTGGWHRLNEPVSMRHFYQGRPESLNTLSTSAKQFVTDFASGQRDAAIRQSFNQAITQHTAAIQKVQEGNGTDQHLLGLQTMMNAHGGKAAFPVAAELFDSDVYQQLTTNFFATASVACDIIDNFSFAPLDPSGYGIYYGILPEKVLLTVSAWQTNPFSAQEVADVIVASAEEIYDWLVAFDE